MEYSFGMQVTKAINELGNYVKAVLINWNGDYCFILTYYLVKSNKLKAFIPIILCHNKIWLLCNIRVIK